MCSAPWYEASSPPLSARAAGASDASAAIASRAARLRRERRASGRGRAETTVTATRGPLEREPRLGKRPPHVGEHGERLGKPERAAEERRRDARAEAPLRARGRPNRAVRRPDGRAPGRSDRGRERRSRAPSLRAGASPCTEGTVRRWTYGRCWTWSRPPRDGARIVLVGIGGHGCAGKTTLARMIPDAQLVSTDEFWNGERLRDRAARREVVEPLARGARHVRVLRLGGAGVRGRHGRSSRAGSWSSRASAPFTARCATPTRCACGSMRPHDVRLARGVARDGEAARSDLGRSVDPVGGALRRARRSRRVRPHRDRRRRARAAESSSSGADGRPASRSPARRCTRSARGRAAATVWSAAAAGRVGNGWPSIVDDGHQLSGSTRM